MEEATKVLNALGLTFVAAIQAVVCNDCQIWVEWKSISTHHKKYHKGHGKDCELLDEAMTALGAKLGVPVLLNLTEPVPGLTIYKMAKQCPMCPKIYCSTKKMRTHNSKIHGQPPGRLWLSCWAQRLNRSTQNRYFRVPELDTPPAFSVEAMVETVVRDTHKRLLEIQEKTTAKDARTISPWLKVTQWHKMVESVGGPTIARSLVADDLIVKPIKDDVVELVKQAVELIPLTHELTLQRLKTGDSDKEYVTPLLTPI